MLEKSNIRSVTDLFKPKAPPLSLAFLSLMLGGANANSSLSEVPFGLISAVVGVILVFACCGLINHLLNRCQTSMANPEKNVLIPFHAPS